MHRTDEVIDDGDLPRSGFLINMGNFDSINESAENSRVKLLQIRVLLHGSNKLLDIGFLPLLLLQSLRKTSAIDFRLLCSSS